MLDVTPVKRRILMFVYKMRTTRSVLEHIIGPDDWTEEDITQALCELEDDNQIEKITKPGEEDGYVPVVETSDLARLFL